jgi:hypothetical protein
MSDQDPILNAAPTVNPYRHAANAVMQRLKWDLKYESWVSRAALKKLKDKYTGQKAVILCNGPSLLKTDFSLLNNVYTFGLNKINLLFAKTDFRPNAIVAVNSFVIEQNMDFYNETTIPLFLDSHASGLLKRKKDVIYLPSSHQVKFARDVSMSVWQGATVTNVAIQLAYHMGFKSVALIGCDHNFAEKGPANLTAIKGNESSHFDPNYFPAGVKWQLPDLVTSEYGYHLAQGTFLATNRQIYNCTDGGKLEIFERKPLIDFINE